jgi:Ice-binding-like
MKRNLRAPLGTIAVLAVLLMSLAVGLSLGATSTAAATTLGAADSGTVGPATSIVGAQCGQSSVPLGSAGSFRVLAGTTVTNTGATVVKGDLGVSPGSAVTGFPPGKVIGTIHKADNAAAHAQRDLLTAYNDAMGRTNCAQSVSGNIGGRTLGPGLYRSTSSLAISSGDLTLTAHGHSGAVFIIQVVSKLTTTSGRQVILAGGAQANNIYWVVGSSATLGTTSVVYGNILAHKSISINTGAKLHGRALAHIGAVTLKGDRVTGASFTGLPGSPSLPAPVVRGPFHDPMLRLRLD